MFPLLLYIALAFSPAPTVHPFFVSVIEAEYFAKDRTVGISCKIFSDDLENTLKKFSGANVDILQGDKQKNRQYLKDYFSKHFQLKLGGRPVALELLGYEIENEACFVYLEHKNADEPRKVEIVTDLLYDLDRSQTNLVHYIANGQRQSTRLNHPNTTAVFNR